MLKETKSQDSQSCHAAVNVFEQQRALYNNI